MCFDDDARPPIPVTDGTGTQGEDITITAADGTHFMAYVATPGNPAETQVLILPDVRGLHQFYKELALRFAEAGTLALAIDYFGRTSPSGDRTNSFEYTPHVESMTIETFGADLRAALGELRGRSDAASTFTVGCCYGGSLSFWSATQGLDLSGVVG
ncbi:MAG TPA: dienelactone hydrolase family protein, partial [Chloroflexota bacterium]|nr:dienelactone hydrolase family protein [Chloroflexota bacterium]